VKRRGRPTKLNAELTRQICKLLHEDCDQKTAASICGVSERAFHYWKERGENGEEPYATFFDAASRARNAYKRRLLKIVLNAAKGVAPRHADWKAATWLLEKNWPREFAPVYREQVPQSQPEPEKQLSVAMILKMPAGSQRETTFEEAEQIYCRFPIIERQEGHEADAAAVEDRDFQRWEQFGIMPNMPDNGDNED